MDAVQENLSRAEKDNDLIYHQEVPAASSLPQIKEVGMVQSMVSEALAEPKTALGNDAVIFGELLGYGAKVAIGLFSLSARCLLDTDHFVADGYAQQRFTKIAGNPGSRKKCWPARNKWTMQRRGKSVKVMSLALTAVTEALLCEHQSAAFPQPTGCLGGDGEAGWASPESAPEGRGSQVGKRSCSCAVIYRQRP